MKKDTDWQGKSVSKGSEVKWVLGEGVGVEASGEEHSPADGEQDHAGP